MTEVLEPRRLFAAGDLDATFSGDGRHTTTIGDRYTVATDVAVQSDGKVVVAGYYSRGVGGGQQDAFVARYTAGGALDTSFGANGFTRVDLGDFEGFQSVAILPNGKIIAGGRKGNTEWILARFQSDGDLDAGSGFGGTDGIRTASGPGIEELAVYNGQIYSIGHSDHLRRHSSNLGSLDNSFGDGGTVRIGELVSEFTAIDLATQADGKIVVVGLAAGDPSGPNHVAAVARFNPDATLDGSFGEGGIARRGFDPVVSHAGAVAIRASDGVIAVAVHGNGPTQPTHVWALNPNGSDRGTTQLPAINGDHPEVRDAAFDQAGRFIVAGGVEVAPDAGLVFYVARMTVGAMLEADGTFSGDGAATVDFGSAADLNSTANAVGVGPNGNVVLAGYADAPSAPSPEAALARLLGGGAGSGGEPTTPFIGIQSGVLVGRGTGGNDAFSVRRTGGDDVIVTINGTSAQFDMDNFTGVRLEGLGGDDTFNLIDPLVSPVVRNMSVVGGAGSDTVDYSARTGALTFNGYLAPDAALAVPFVNVTSGAQLDRVSSDVERFVGGSGGDSFSIHDGQEFGSDDFDMPNLTLEGRGGNDSFGSPINLRATMLGGAGNDSFSFEEGGEEVVFAGDGDDVFNFFEQGVPVSLDAGAGLDTARLEESFRELFDMRLYPGLEDATGVHGLTAVIGNALNNRITARPGDDDGVVLSISGGGGNDTIIGGGDHDSLSGDAGNDSLVGGNGDDTLDGGAGTDTLDGGAGSNTLLNGEVFPGAGQPTIAITSGVLTATGAGGNDTISIERVLTDDVLVRIGSLSRTFDMDDFTGVLLQGLGGNDTITVLDAITTGSITRKVTVEGGAGDDSITGSAGEEVLRGGEGGDTLAGLGGADALFGQAGDDFLFAGAGADFLDGGDNDDFLDATDSAAGDTLQGGNGNDSAEVDAGDGVSNVETIV